jgi:hypothetical protein
MPVSDLRKPTTRSADVGYVENFREMLVQVNIGITDRRDNLSAFSDVISEREAANIARVLGTVTCRSPGYKSESQGFVVEDGRQIETNVHVFTDENFKLLDPLPTCTFATKANPKRKYKLLLKEGWYKFGTSQPNSDRVNDFAFIRLDGEVENVEPLKFGAPPMPGETVYMISTGSDYSKKSLDPRQLVGRICTNLHTYRENANTNSSFLNDCDCVKGDSSSLYFANRGGVLEAVGLHQSGGWPTANGLEFNITTKDKDKLSYGMGLGFDAKMLSMSAELAKSAVERSNARLGRKLNSASSRNH